jgi:hypothetical protein
VESDKEDTDQLVMDLFNKTLGLDIHEAQIDRSHRVGRNDTKNLKKILQPPRDIIVKFISYRVREKVLHARKEAFDLDIHINADLTRQTSELAYLAREARRQHRIVQTMVKEGKVLVRAGHQERLAYVASEADLERYIAENPTYSSATRHNMAPGMPPLPPQWRPLLALLMEATCSGPAHRSTPMLTARFLGQKCGISPRTNKDQSEATICPRTHNTPFHPRT